MIKKLLSISILAIGFLFITNMPFAYAQNKTELLFFYGEGCPHCAKEEIFLDKMEEKYSDLEIKRYEVWGNKNNRDLMIKTAKELDANANGVPLTVIGETYFVGYGSEETTGKQIEEAILNTFSNTGNATTIPETIKLPFLGEVETKSLSLPVLTIVIGVLDGFNPCAMWTLIFLISLLLGMANKKRMWLLGSTFIVGSAAVYFAFLAAWLNLLLFVGFIPWVRIGIGLVALIGGGYYLKEYVYNKDNTCKVTGSEKKKKVFDKLREFAHEKNLIVALFGILLLAFAVNLVELVCSAGLPAVYTQVLTMSNLSSWQYYLYLLLYVFFFMIDDLFIFFAAMITLQMTGLSTKYSRMSHLIGGTLMLIIGILLIFKPEILTFG